MTRRAATLALVTVLLLLAAAAILLWRPDSFDTAGGSDARAGAGAPAPPGAESPSGSGWWDRIRRRLGLGGSGPGLRGSGNAADSGGDSERPPWLRVVDGIVVDAQGLPVANAEVRRLSRDKSLRGSDRVRSGADGTFRIEVRTLDHPEDYLEASAPGRRSRRVGTKTLPLRLQLLAESRLEVVVRVARTGEPVQGAEVSITPGPLADVPYALSADARGRATLEASPATAYVIRIRAPGFAPALARAQSIPGKTEVVLVDLGRGAVVRGTVLDHLGTPLASAHVELSARLDLLDAFAIFEKRTPVETKTDSTGAFEFRHVPAGAAHVTLGARAEDGRTAGTSLRTLGEGEERAVELRLPKPISVSGRVVRLDGSAVAEGTVQLEVDFDEPLTTQPNAAGEFEFRDVNAKRGRLTIRFLDASGEMLRDASLWPGAHGGLHRVTLVVPPPTEQRERRVLEVRVLDARGSPLLRATVSADGHEETTNERGIASVPVGEAPSVELWVRPPDGLEQRFAVDLPTEGPAEVRLRDGIVDGRVLRENGSPSRSVVVLKPRREKKLGDAVLRLFVGGGDASATALADATGAFRFAGVGEGDHVLAFRESDDLPWSTQDVRAGDADVTLRVPAPSDRAFEVTVVGEPGTSLGDTLVAMSIEDREGVRWSGILLPVAGQPGTFRSKPHEADTLAPGTYDVSIATGRGGPPEKLLGQRIGGGVHRWTVRRAVGRRLEGAVRSPDGRGVDGAFVLAGPVGWQERAERAPLVATTDADGRYEIVGVVPGRLEVALRPLPWAWAATVVDVGVDPVTPLDFAAQPGGVIEVWSIDGRPPPERTKVVLRRFEGGATSFDRVQDAGGDAGEPWAELHGVRAGRLLWSVVVDGAEAHRGEVKVETGETTIVVVPR
jgi:protocatechuate 3,4-dioxygenase beta subunit